VRSLIRVLRSIYCRARVGFRNTGIGFLVGRGTTIARECKFGDHVYIGPGGIIYPHVNVGNYSMLGPSVYIMGQDHLFDVVGSPIIFSGRPSLPSTSIGRDVWLGARVFVKCGVRIGDGCIVGAGSVVIDDLPPNSIAVGVPARVVRQRFLEDAFHKHMKSIDERAFMPDYAPRI
jgi:acetyltransferase-like isoleucine patch superfamily enzyme